MKRQRFRKKRGHPFTLTKRCQPASPCAKSGQEVWPFDQELNCVRDRAGPRGTLWICLVARRAFRNHECAARRVHTDGGRIRDLFQRLVLTFATGIRFPRASARNTPGNSLSSVYLTPLLGPSRASRQERRSSINFHRSCSPSLFGTEPATSSLGIWT
jgi:hypothetical protein